MEGARGVLRTGSRRSIRRSSSPCAGLAPRGPSPTTGNSTLVEFFLEAEGGQTRLRVVESGFRLLSGTPEENAEYAAGNVRGWTAELAELRDYVTRLAGVSA